MDESCRKCGAPIFLPSDLIMAGPEKAGIAKLDQCLTCGHTLSSHWAAAQASINDYSTNEWQQSQMLRGRATLSASLW
jgi:hypothetical protein